MSRILDGFEMKELKVLGKRDLKRTIEKRVRVSICVEKYPPTAPNNVQQVSKVIPFLAPFYAV